MKIERRLLLGIAAALVAGALAAPVTVAEQILPGARTGADVRGEFGHTGVSGWMVVDLDTGEVLDQGNADHAFAPASVAKLPTAAFALDALGPGHRFETRLLATAPIRDGRIAGDLVLQGRGDPELDTDSLDLLMKDLAGHGVRAVTGAFVVDGTALPQVAEIEVAQSEDASYNPAISGLNLNFNRVHVKWDARQGHDRLSVEAAAKRLRQPVDDIRVAVVGDRGAAVFAHTHRDGREVWEMARRAYRGKAARWLPVKRPEVHAGEVFRRLAHRQGIDVAAPFAGRVPDGAEVLAVRRSRPLAEILRDMLRYSTNLTAEVAGAAATRAIGVKAQSLEQSAATMNAWAASVSGFAMGDPGFRMVNHSGLTLGSRVSPRRMVELLAALGRRAPDEGAGHARLPGGIAGYLKPHNVAAESVPLDYSHLSVVAKTGTMSYVRGLAGYIATPGGRRLAFAIFSNDLERRGAGPQPVDRRWMGRARGFERALIRNWVLLADGSA